MRNENRVNKVILQKIIGYCNDIEKFMNRFGNNFENFISDRAFQMSCGMCIIQIGELTTRLSEDFKEKISEIEWNKIKGLRNIFAHDYESVKFEVLWEILTEDIPALKESLQKIFEQMS